MSMSTPAPILERDRYGRPMVVPPGGGRKVAYTRCTTYVSCLEDTYNLSRWQQRQVALGLAQRPDLVGMVHAKADDKRGLDQVCEDAMEAAKSSAAANTGTALHALTEQVDRGELTVDQVPADFRPDVEAYLRATEGLRHEHIEAFTVLDDLKIGGTPDRVSTTGGRRVIVDLKTGSVDYGMGKIAMQLAVYSRSLLYDIGTGLRSELGVDQAMGLIVHVPAGTGTARLLTVDLEAGWQAVQLATQVRAWRARKDLSQVITTVEPQDYVSDALPDDLDTLRSLWEQRPDLRSQIEAKVAALQAVA